MLKTDADHPYRDPEHPGNRIRPNVKCVGCGKKGCITYWGPWCFTCNVERMDRIDAYLATTTEGGGKLSAVEEWEVMMGASGLKELKAGTIDDAMERAGAVPEFVRPRLTSLSVEAQRLRRPIEQTILLEARQDQPEMQTRALSKRFMRPQRA